METEIPVLSSPINFKKAIENVSQDMSNLSKALSKKENQKYGPPEVNFMIFDTQGTTIELPPRVEEIDKRVAQILQYEPIFKIAIFFADTKYSDKSGVAYEYDLTQKIAVLQKVIIGDEETHIEEKHKTKGIYKLATELIRSICILITKKAEEEMYIFKKWEKLLA